MSQMDRTTLCLNSTLSTTTQPYNKSYLKRLPADEQGKRRYY